MPNREFSQLSCGRDSFRKPPPLAFYLSSPGAEETDASLFVLTLLCVPARAWSSRPVDLFVLLELNPLTIHSFAVHSSPLARRLGIMLP